VTVTGPTDPTKIVTIGCDNNGKRQFSFTNLPNTTITLQYLTLRKGNVADNGGCVYASNVQNITLLNVTLDGCSATNGGGLYSDSVVNITFATFTLNQASTNGGALYLQSLANGSSISNSSITSNSAANGAGLYLFGDYLYIVNSIVANNNATSFSGLGGYGGGLYLATPNPNPVKHEKIGTYNFLNTNFTNNNATLQGGGVYAENLNHTWNIYGALFVDNWSTDIGDSNIACNATAMEFCHGCTTTDCVTGCTVDGFQSCSQNTTNTKSVFCYGSRFTMCTDPSCKCKAIVTKVEKILIVIIALLLVVGVTLIAVDVIRFVIRRRRENSTYTPIK